MSEQQDAAAGRPRRRAERLLGAPARSSAPGPPRPPSERAAAPRAVLWAALVVAVEALALFGAGVYMLYLTVAGHYDSLGRALGGVVLLWLFAAGLIAAALGMRRSASWSRGPVIAVQILLALLGYTAAFQASAPQYGVPVLVLVATESYLLATPEARLAFTRRR